MSTTRRRFLSAAAGTSLVSLSPVVPNFLLHASAAEGKKSGDNILVVVQLSGGNDGLNTVIPFGNDEYYKNRSTLAIGRDQIRKIDDYVGFHPAMSGFADLLEAGKLGVVQGVGYPNPNRSHFESMDIWHTCQRKKGSRPTGWLGRFLDASRQAAGGDVPGLHLGGEDQPLALAGENIHVPSIRSFERFRLRDLDVQRVRETLEADAAKQADDDLLRFVRSTAISAIGASRRVESSLKQYKTNVTYPQTGLAQKMKTVAQLIDADLSTRVYYLSLDGFDTHANQEAAHTALVGELSAAVTAFINDLAAHGHSERVMVMSFSEFGRRVKENASRGTDHGAAAPMFLAGSKVKSGLVGKHPSMTDLQIGDLKHHTDFRQVYAAILKHWLGWNPTEIVGGEYQPITILS
ncbi:MAG: DUF1501 domain-containing protein [Pirellulales bacterium]